MRTIQTNLYKYDELNSEAQEVARNWYKDGDDMPFLEEDMEYQLDELLKGYKIKPINVEARYSLSYCQGDGASFTGNVEWGAYRATITTNQWGNHYSHSKTVTVSELNSLKTDKDAPVKKWEELQSIIEDIGDKLSRYGYEAIEAAMSDDNVADNILANEYEFTEDGKRA